MRKILFFIIIIISSLFVSQKAAACDCLYWGKFADYVADGKAVKARIISYGERLPHGKTLYETMTVEVIGVVKGEFAPKTIIFWGDPGHLCRDYVDSRKFKIGSEFLFAVGGDKKDQALGGCGESSILIKNDKVHGQEWIDYEAVPYETNYDEFIKILNAPRDTPPPKKQVLSGSR